MKKGSYSDKIDFESFKVKKFVPYLYDYLSYSGCGGAALCTLTGEEPSKMPVKKDWTPKYMYWHLRRSGFKIQELTVRGVTNFVCLNYPISSRHVILARLMFIRKEASWVIMHNGMLYHGFELTKLQPYEMINHPMLSSCLLQHPSWGEKEKPSGLRSLGTARPFPQVP